MELSKTANEVIVQAHMLRMSSGNKTLCVEHLLYGLLLLGRYHDEPFDKPEFRQEAEDIRERLEKNFRSVESAKRQIELDAKELGTEFQDSKAVIGRAAELAEKRGGNVVSSECILTAILESPTPTIRALMGLTRADCSAGDKKYRGAKTPDKNTPERPEKRPSAPPQKENGLTTSQLELLAAMFVLAKNQERENLKGGKSKADKKGKTEKRFTKMGPFTYRGGAVSAAIQYFLFGLIVPFALLFGLEKLWAIVTVPPNPWVGFLVNVFVVLWGFYLVRGVTKLFGLISKASGNFLDILADCALIIGIAESARWAFEIEGFPIWMRTAVCVGALVVFGVGFSLYGRLKGQNDVQKAGISCQNINGTPDRVFFQLLTRDLFAPLIIFSIVWIFNLQIAVWAEKTLWILGFFWVWNVTYNLWSCMAQHLDKKHRLHTGRIIARFAMIQHVLLMPPGFVFFLYWLFSWSPMQTWVIMVLSLYGVFWVMASIANLIGVIKGNI